MKDISLELILMTETNSLGQAWWHTSVVPAQMGRDDHELKASLDVGNPEQGHRQDKGSKYCGRQLRLFAGVGGSRRLCGPEGVGWRTHPGRQRPSVRHELSIMQAGSLQGDAHSKQHRKVFRKMKPMEGSPKRTTTRSQRLLNPTGALRLPFRAISQLCPSHRDRDFGEGSSVHPVRPTTSGPGTS